MVKFKLTNFQITIPKDTEKLKNQIETLKGGIEIMEIEIGIIKKQIRVSKELIGLLEEDIETIEKKKSFKKDNLLIHKKALSFSQKEYEERFTA